MDAILWSNINCNDATHCNDQCEMYNSIVNAIQEASRPLHTHPRKVKNIKPGWNKYVADHQEAAKMAHRAWVIAGRPRHGPDLERKKLTNARYKYAVHFIGKHEQALRAHTIAENLLGNNVTDFWKEVKAINRAKAALPHHIEGVSGADNIAKLNEEVIHFTPNEDYHAIEQLADNKVCGKDNIAAEHLKLASPRVAALLSICLTGLMTHSILPDTMLTVILVPVIKDRVGKIGSLDNYRPITLASILSKVLEKFQWQWMHHTYHSSLVCQTRYVG